jgi:hemoglobin
VLGFAARDISKRFNSMSTLDSTPYRDLGGEEGVRKLVHRFYQLMDTLPEAADIRAMHPEDLSSSEEKLFLFLSGFFGGPSLYIEKFGHPMLRQRHMPFPIDEAARDQWLLCMNRALDDVGVTPKLKEFLGRIFFQTANHMRNKEGQ